MADLADLLDRTSRTFALTIPLLPEPTATEVKVAYLLFRIADTFEDAASWPIARRCRALSAFGALLDPSLPPRFVPDRGETVRAWLEPPAPSDNEGYLALLADTGAVLDALNALRPAARDTILIQILRTVMGMVSFVTRSTDGGGLTLDTLEDLKSYCFTVAGIVGVLLTRLFMLEVPALGEGACGMALRTHAVAFGEGLQLVNILKDSDDDARDGRVYLPRSVSRETVFDLARRDLVDAGIYVRALFDAGAPRGFVAFTALPVLLARAALRAVEVNGPGAKVGRPEVLAITQNLHACLDAGVFPLGDDSDRAQS